jgi:hypothetical protein
VHMRDAGAHSRRMIFRTLPLSRYGTL